MKTMTCKEMGGDCSFATSANTSKEMANKMTEHIIESHPGVALKMKGMTPDEHATWEKDFHKNWDKAPEVA